MALSELRRFRLRDVQTVLFGQPKTDEGFFEDAVLTVLVRILDHLCMFEGRCALTN